MGVGSPVTVFVILTSFFCLFITFALPITLILKNQRDSRRHKWDIERKSEPPIRQTSIQQPDDLGHAYALIRAHDRHLISIDLPAIGGGDTQVLNSWKVTDPDAEVWWIDKYGRADTRPYKTLLQAELRKASDSSGGREQDSL